MDLVLLVIAADEGIMPQTREHMDILNLLGIEKSIIVLNKCDLVDEEWLEMMEEDVREELSGTFWNMLSDKVPAATGEGLGDLVKEIEHQTRDEVVQKDIHTIPRLPIDRVFSLSGFGTIITGTLVSGTITKEDTLQMYPVGTECKIRSIQVHGEDKKECYAGQRVAINLSNVKKKEIKRGCVLAPLNSMKNTDLLDVKLNDAGFHRENPYESHPAAFLYRNHVKSCAVRYFWTKKRSDRGKADMYSSGWRKKLL